MCAVPKKAIVKKSKVVARNGCDSRLMAKNLIMTILLVKGREGNTNSRHN